MRLSWLLVANAFVVGLFGVVALLLPGPLYDSFGGTSDVGSQFVVQILGAALIGEALLRFFVRDIEPGRIRNVMTSAFLGEYLLAVVAAVQAQLGGVTNAIGWVIVALFSVFALGYAYFRFVATEQP